MYLYIEDVEFFYIWHIEQLIDKNSNACVLIKYIDQLKAKNVPIY